jgi:hypothetical protein
MKTFPKLFNVSHSFSLSLVNVEHAYNLTSAATKATAAFGIIFHGVSVV